MLPTTGFFKDIDCPYYYDSTCGRPYCHFRHRKRNQDSSEDSQDGTENKQQVPTYNPTPKSQLQQGRSHIPISYVPDIVVRTERSFRNPPTYSISDKLTYKPTPLSELITIKANALDDVQTNGDDINFEELSTEFDMIDDIINEKECIEETSNNNIVNHDESKQTSESKTKSTSGSKDDRSKNEHKSHKSSKSEKRSSRGESKSDRSKDRKRSADDSGSRKSSSKTREKNSSKSGSSAKNRDDGSAKNRDDSSGKNRGDGSTKDREDSTKTREDSTKHREDSTKHREDSTKHREDSMKNREDSTKNREDSMKNREDSTKNREDSTKHREDSTKHREDSTKHREDSTKHREDSTKHREDSTKNREELKHRESEKGKHKDKHSRSKDERTSEKSKDSKKVTSDTKGKHRDSKDRHKESRSKEHKRSKHKERSTKTRREKDVKNSVSCENEELISGGISDSEDILMEDQLDDDCDTKYSSVEEECFRIFNEYKPEPIHPPDPLQKAAEAEYIPTPKKRIAHQGADIYTPKLAHIPPKPTQNPAIAMMNRFKAAKIAQANNEQNNIFGAVRNIKRSHSEDEDNKPSVKVPRITPPSNPKKENVSVIDDIINGSTSSTKVSNEYLMKAKVKKIAPVQNINLFQQAKAKAELAKRNLAAKTPVQTIGKGTKRVAHVPDMSMGDLPDVLQPENKKIPVNVRTRYLTMIADECLKLYLLKHDAYDRALNEELKVVERCAAVITYRNSAMLTVNRIRKELQERNAKGLGPISADNIEDSDKNSQYKGRRFYENILQYTLTEEDLDIHGYPREGPVSGKAVIKTQKQMPKVNLNQNQRLCCRCYKVYMVDECGMPSYEEECIYHPLKKRTIRGDRIYLCCKSSEDTGCVTANTHVCETEAELEGYQATMEPDRDDDPRSYAVYALDCEMCYTTKGLELTRVTVVDCQCKTVYESLVKPLNPIIDYNTQFSGITKDQMDRTSTSILQVQANILHLCNSQTILIGHSLESDMKALKIIHSNIIDTAVLFPHRLGLPLKKALRVLAGEFLKKIIQSNVNGHDSAEDALTCMELVMWKLKEDLKLRGVK